MIRKICVLHLLNSKRVQSFRQIREDEVLEMILTMRLHPRPVDIYICISILSNDVKETYVSRI